MDIRQFARDSKAVHALAKPVLKAAWLVAAPMAAISRRVYQLSKQIEFAKDWRVPPHPEWFDHEFDLAFFARERRPHFFERGVYASEVCDGKRVLDLCCGDGSVAALFLSPLARDVLGVDFDPKAIEHARRKWSSIGNLRFQVMDIRAMPASGYTFDAIVWDAAIEHLTLEEMTPILQRLKGYLAPGGALHGSTVKRQERLQHHDHEHEFDSLEEMKTLLAQHFKHVTTWERVHPDRTAFYFRCSDDNAASR
jgi:2-polyprenyl-3-methyl-5-hydroxy-6-metoxy-1,4-benzoquinol methylase